MTSESTPSPRSGQEAERLRDSIKTKPVYPPGKEPLDLPTITLPELRAKELPVPLYLVDKLIPRGVYVIQGGKAAGKSLLAQHIAWCVATGSRVFRMADWAPDPAGRRVLYLFYEGGEYRAKKRFSCFPETPLDDNLVISYERIVLNEAGVERVKQWLNDNGPWALVVVDMVTQVTPRFARNSSDGDYQAVSDFLDRIRTMGQELGVTVLLLRHTRKGGADDHTEAGLGSTGWSTAVDGTITLRHNRVKHIATIEITGNDVMNDALFRVDTSNGPLMDFIGYGKELTEKQELVYDQMKGQPGVAMTPTDIITDLGDRAPARSTVQSILQVLVETRMITNMGGGSYAYVS